MPKAASIVPRLGSTRSAAPRGAKVATESLVPHSILTRMYIRNVKSKFWFWSVLGRFSAKVGPGTVTNGPGLKKQSINQRKLTRETDSKAPKLKSKTHPYVLPSILVVVHPPGKPKKE